MSFLKKRETPVQNIAYIGIMAAINVVFVLISSLLPVLFILLVFILPLTSVIVTIYCKKYYYPVYFITTLALTFAVTAGFSIFDTFIYVLPSLITGFIFGILIEKNFPAIYILIINTIAQFGLTFLTFLFLDKVVAQVNFFESIYQLIGLGSFQYKAVLTNIFTYIIAQMQIALTYILVKYEMSRVCREVNLECKNRFILYIVTLCGLAVTILSVFYFPDWSIILTLLVLPITIYEVLDLSLLKRMVIYFAIGVSLLIGIFIFAFLYKFIPNPNQLILIYVFFVLITIIDSIFNYCLKPKAENIK